MKIQTLQQKGFPISMRSKIQSSLIELGYELNDYGNHWRTKALYRNGNNNSSLKIYKDTGVWQDFVQSKAPMPFKKLIELTLNTTDYSVIQKYLLDAKEHAEETLEKKEKLEMEKVYPEECLKKLFPNYSFYKKREISEEIQKQYKCGLASAGRMYRRIVFPIYNDIGQIFGFAGRKVTDEDENSPKWKLIGRKSNWIYPAYIPDFPEINDEVILVESVGDSMALSQNGYYNNLVMFGLDCSSTLINFLVSKNLNSIYISTNNDSSSDVNRGLVSSIKTLIKLSSYFDLQILKIKPPLLNDFGEMQNSDNPLLFSDWRKRKELSLDEILKFIKENEKEFDKTKLAKFYKKCLNE
jgi:hypothetical protein